MAIEDQRSEIADDHSPRRGRPIVLRPAWEAAYKRFETPEQEIQKFIGRLTRFGFADLLKQARIVEIFCGRGNGLVALERMGFTNLEGVDLSDSLLEEYQGPASCIWRIASTCRCKPTRMTS